MSPDCVCVDMWYANALELKIKCSHHRAAPSGAWTRTAWKSIAFNSRWLLFNLVTLFVCATEWRRQSIDETTTLPLHVQKVRACMDTGQVHWRLLRMGCEKECTKCILRRSPVHPFKRSTKAAPLSIRPSHATSGRPCKCTRLRCRLANDFTNCVLSLFAWIRANEICFTAAVSLDFHLLLQTTNRSTTTCRRHVFTYLRFSSLKNMDPVATNCRKIPVEVLRSHRLLQIYHREV